MKSTTKKLVSCALCIAIGVLLPMAFHVIPNAGSIFLPMHIPVLICGLFCGTPIRFGMWNDYTLSFQYDNRNASSYDFAPNDD